MMSPCERCAGTRLSLLKWRGAKSEPAGALPASPPHPGQPCTAKIKNQIT